MIEYTYNQLIYIIGLNHILKTSKCSQVDSVIYFYNSEKKINLKNVRWF